MKTLYLTNWMSNKPQSCRYFLFKTAFNQTDMYIDYALFSIVILFQNQGSIIDAALIATAFALPTLLFSNKIGHYVDHYNPMFIASIASCIILSGAIMTLFFLNHSTLLYFCIMLKTLGRSSLKIAQPKIISLLITQKARYQAAYGLIGILNNTGRVIGPLLAIALLTTLNISALIYFSIFISLLTVLAASLLQTTLKYQPNTKQSGNLKQHSYQQSIKFLFSNKLMTIGFIAFLASLLSLFLSNDLIAYLFKFAGAKETDVGYLICLMGIGGIIGSFLSGIIKDTDDGLNLFTYSIVLNALAFTIFGTLLILPILYIATLLTGLASGFSTVGFQSLLQNKVPSNKIGQVVAHIQTTAIVLAIICPLIGAFFANSVGLSFPFQLSAIGMLIIFFTTLFYKQSIKKEPVMSASKTSQIIDQSLLNSEVYRIYDLGRKKGNWELTIDWDKLNHTALSTEQLEYSWKLASLSSNVEMLGMMNAASLLAKCDDPALKFCLAQAANDEARHCEVFTRYALKVKGFVLDVREQKSPVHEHFDSLTEFDDIFLSHVHLENLALETFAIFVNMYEGELLGDLYQGALRDEARHVSMGAAYFKNKAKKNPTLLKSYQNHHKKYQEIFEISAAGIRDLAKIANLTQANINNRINKRINNFVSKINGSNTI